MLPVAPIARPEARSLRFLSRCRQLPTCFLPRRGSGGPFTGGVAPVDVHTVGSVDRAGREIQRAGQCGGEIHGSGLPGWLWWPLAGRRIGSLSSYRLPPAPRGKFRRGARTRAVASFYPAGMVRTWARVAGFQQMNPMVESSAMRSAVAFLGRSPSLSSWAGMKPP